MVPKIEASTGREAGSRWHLRLPPRPPQRLPDKRVGGGGGVRMSNGARKGQKGRGRVSAGEEGRMLQLCPTLCDPMNCSPSLPGSSVLWDSPGKNTGVGSREENLPGNLSNLGSEPRSPTLQADSLPSEPPGKPRNTRVGSLSLLQRSSDPGIKLGSTALQADSLPAELPGKPS